jgi:hypothetical protein
MERRLQLTKKDPRDKRLFQPLEPWTPDKDDMWDLDVEESPHSEQATPLAFSRGGKGQKRYCRLLLRDAWTRFNWLLLRVGCPTTHYQNNVESKSKLMQLIFNIYSPQENLLRGSKAPEAAGQVPQVQPPEAGDAARLPLPPRAAQQGDS